MPAARAHAEAPQVEKLLYSREDVAYALSISLRTVDRLIANQDLKTRRLRGRVVISAGELRRFVERVEKHDVLLERSVRLERVK